MLFLFLLINFFCAIGGYQQGKERQIGPVAGLLLGLFLNIIGLIIVLVSPKLNYSDTNNSLAPNTIKQTTAAEELTKWYELKEKGIITEEEFEMKKREFL